MRGWHARLRRSRAGYPSMIVVHDPMNWPQMTSRVVVNPTYKAPTLGIGAAGTSLITLGGAWSAALIGVVLSVK